MKKAAAVPEIFLSLLIVMSVIECTSYQESPSTPSIDYVEYVDPFIGTKYGHTSPGSAVPFAMTTWDPVRKEEASGISYPYDYSASEIAGFRGSHYPSGSCVSDYACITIMPESGDLVLGPERASSFSHESEEASPGYYAVTLDDYGIRVEVTSTMRVGLMRFTFSQAGDAHILVDTHLGVGYAKIIPENDEIVGYSDVGRYRGPTGEFKGYFVVRFSKSFSSYGTWEQGTQAHPGDDEIKAYNSGAWATFSVEAGESIMVKASISFISIDQARANMEAEIPDWDFDRVRTEAHEAWNRELGKIEVEGGTEADKIKFYTALYHCLVLPRVSSEYGRYYSVFDGQVHSCEGREFYNDFSLWDTFRAEHALLILLEPRRVEDMCQSLVWMYEQGGWMPKWPNPGYSSIMIGTHADSVITETYLKGLTNFDVEKAYEGMLKNAMQTPPIFYEARTGIGEYMKFGYVPADVGYRESCSLTLEYAYDDWCIAQLAKALGKEDDYWYFMERATYWRNVFDPSVGFVRGRNSDGSWVDGSFDPRGYYSYITQPNEGDPWQYTWSVFHDVQGLINLMGGRENFSSKLQTFLEKSEEPRLLAENKFTEGGRVRYYWHGNEPSQHTPYLFDYCGEPWKTQYWVRNVTETRYRLGPYGLPGNDDCGQTSAWYVFSAMGFYPVCPPSLTYVIGSPIFDRITIHLDDYHYGGKDIVIIAHNNSPENIYIQSVKLNGEPLDKPWFWHSDITNGAVLEFWMGSEPNYEWGSDPEDAPPSMSEIYVPSEFSISNLIISPEVISPGGQVMVSVDVTNTGEVSGSYTVELSLDGSPFDNRVVFLEPGQSITVNFTVSESKPGIHVVSVDGLTGTFEVSEPTNPSETFPTIVAAVALVVAMLSCLLYCIKKRRGGVSK